MTKLYVDVSMLMVGTSFTGIPRVVMEVSRRLYHNKNLELVFLEYDQRRDGFRVIDTQGFIRFCKTREGSRQKLRSSRLIDFGAFEKNAVFFDMDTVWKTRVRRSWLYPRLKAQGVRIIPFIQDIIGVTHPGFCPFYDRINFIDFIGAALIYSEKIIVTSHATEHAIEELGTQLAVSLPQLVIAPLGGNFGKQTQSEASVTETSDEVRKAVAAGKYLLMVGTLEPRKNHKLLLDAYDAGLNNLDMNLIIAGYKGWNMDDFFERLEKHPDYGKRIFHISKATDADIAYLYGHCYSLAFPSYIEGYGLPIMEAFVRGVPVFAADTEINQEIGREYAVYFRKDQPTDLVEKVESLLKNPQMYELWKNRITEFVPPTWEETADRIMDVLL